MYRMHRNNVLMIFCLVIALCLAEQNPAMGQRSRLHSRRPQRVKMEQVQVTSPDGNIELTILPNAERLSFTVTMGNTAVIDTCSFEGMKEFSRMAGELGYEYHILEGFWSKWSDEQIKEIVEYSKKQGVRLLFWKHSNQLSTPQQREEFFARLHSLGVAGAKIDFFDHEAKEVIDHYEALFKKAAENQMVVDFHDANKPTGRQRTWPNELVREAVCGMESSSLRERARHETILPFARYLAGPADYTTMHFGDRRQDTTWTHQIASLVIFASPLLTVAAHLQSILDGTRIDKWDYVNHTTERLLSGEAYDCARNNGSKSNPCLCADILGDWREEVIWRTRDNTELRIFTTTILTDRQFYTLMHDPVYRLSVAWQNVAYNQPAQPGFYFGEGMTAPPRPDIVLVGTGD